LETKYDDDDDDDDVTPDPLCAGSIYCMETAHLQS